jgi:hypothetical protein
MMAFVVALLITLAMTAGIVVFAARRPVGAALSWAEGMLSAVYVYATLFLAYGVVPHQWLAWSDNQLKWRQDIIMAGPGSKSGSLLHWLPFSITKVTLRDLIVSGIYVVFLGLHIAMWAIWQNRGKKKAPLPLESAYGRPLVRKG